jgi:hypothetical protein
LHAAIYIRLPMILARAGQPVHRRLTAAWLLSTGSLSLDLRGILAVGLAESGTDLLRGQAS